MRVPVKHLAAAVLALLILAACSPLPPATAAAVVDGTQIPRDAIERGVVDLDLDELRAQVDASLPADLTGPARRAAVQVEVDAVVLETQRRVLDLYIRQEIVRIVAADAGVTISEADRDLARDQLLVSIGGPDALPEALARAQLTVGVFEEVIVEQEALIEALRQDLLADIELEVREPRHILLDSEAEAAAVRAELEAGADFAEVAERVSLDPGSAPSGGALPASPRGAWLPEFDEAVWSAELGELVGPIETQAGFHLIEVVDEATLTGEDIPPAQRDQLVGGDLDARFFGTVAAAEIRVDPAFGTWSTDPSNPALLPVRPVGLAPVGVGGIAPAGS